MSTHFLTPPALARGDHIHVVAPAGPFSHEQFAPGLERLRERYDVELAPDASQRSGFFAGDDQRRLDELNRALRCPHNKAIVTARGGVGCTRIAHLADFDSLRDAPKWLVGFSDITALHAEVQARQLCSLHAANVTGLGALSTPAWKRWCEALEAPTTPRTQQLTTLVDGRAEGLLVGGNLSLLHTSALTRRFRAPEPSILFVEEVGEAPYRIDRMLVSLSLSGALDGVVGLVVGEISDAKPGPHGVEAKQVFADFAERLAIPALWGQPSGHGKRNDPLHLGQLARIEDGRFTTCAAPMDE